MPLSREAQQVSKDISEALEIYSERQIKGALDPIAVTIQIARLIGEERRGERSKAGSVPLTSTRLNTGTDPVSVARRSPKIPFAPPPSAEVKSKRVHKKKEVRSPVAPRAEAASKKRSRSSRRR